KETFQDQVDDNGKPILMSAKVLLVGTPLGTTARTLLRSEKLIDGSSTDKQPEANPHHRSLDLAVSPYLNNTSITDQDGNALSGQSDTQWYLFANPMVRAAINVGFLNGQRMPTIQS